MEDKKWHLIDAKNKILGRLSTEVANILTGKNKVSYQTNIDHGDYVVIINAKEVVFSGKKEVQKKYYHHSGYPGGLKSQTASQIRSKRPETLLRHSIVGMLPKNKIGRAMVKKLFVFPTAEHPYANKLKTN